MALDKSKLAKGFKEWFEAGVKKDYSPADGLDMFCDAYESYAMEAEDFWGNTPISVMKPLMRIELTPIITPIFKDDNPKDLRNRTEQSFIKGLIAFWKDGLFSMTNPPPSLVLLQPNKVIAPPVTIDFSKIEPTDNIEDAANAWADAFDAATKTVKLLCEWGTPAPPAPPAPTPTPSEIL